MIFVDSSVWIDYLRGTPTLAAQKLDSLLGGTEVLVGDLVLAEVLQGIRHDHAFEHTLALMTQATLVNVSDDETAVQAARNYRLLRARGITIRKTIDTLIATRCIMDGHHLLFSDRDFDPFVEHLGLQSALD